MLQFRLSKQQRRPGVETSTCSLAPSIVGVSYIASSIVAYARLLSVVSIGGRVLRLDASSLHHLQHDITSNSPLVRLLGPSSLN